MQNALVSSKIVEFSLSDFPDLNNMLTAISVACDFEMVILCTCFISQITHTLPLLIKIILFSNTLDTTRNGLYEDNSVFSIGYCSLGN